AILQMASPTAGGRPLVGGPPPPAGGRAPAIGGKRSAVGSAVRSTAITPPLPRRARRAAKPRVQIERLGFPDTDLSEVGVRRIEQEVRFPRHEGRGHRQDGGLETLRPVAADAGESMW